MNINEQRAKIVALGNAFMLMRAATINTVPDDKKAQIDVMCIEGVIELLGELAVDVKRIADNLAILNKS